MKKAIIFDLYDTLIFSKIKLKPYLEIIKKLNYNSIDSKAFVEYLMTNNCSLSDNYMPPYMKDLVDKNFFDKLEIELNSTVVYEDTYEVLEKLSKKYRLFCLSNLATPYIIPYFNLNIDKYIEKPFFSCLCSDKKPNSTFFEQVINFSNLDKKDFIMIGDNIISDYRGALNAGIDAIHLTTLTQATKFL